MSSELCMSGFIGNPTRLSKPDPCDNNPLLATAFALILSGDVQLNPGPKLGDINPRGFCELVVDWSQAAVGCDNCSLWFHKTCVSITSAEYSKMHSDSGSWYCFKCDNHNVSSFTYHSYAVDVSNYYDPLCEHQHNDIVFSISSPSELQSAKHSSPLYPTSRVSQNTAHQYTGIGIGSIRTESAKSGRTSHDSSSTHQHNLPPKRSNLRSLVINCNGISNKRAELENLINYADPDIILLTETKIDNIFRPAEFLPPQYCGDIRKDRVAGGGGVMIATKNGIVCEPLDINVNCELVLAKVKADNNTPFIVGSFYRPPGDNSIDPIEQLEQALDSIQEKVKNNPRTTILLGGDFNAAEINWEECTVQPGARKTTLCQKIIEVLGKFSLQQFVNEPNREDNILDLFCLNKPSLLKSINVIPGISDHEVIVAECDINVSIPKCKPHKLFLWSKVNRELLKEQSRNFKDRFMTVFHSRDVETNYKAFVDHINSIMEEHVPSKMTKSRFRTPWLTSSVKRMCRKKQRLFNRAKRSIRNQHWEAYRSHKKATLKALRRGRWDYINNILQLGLEEGSSQPFWRYVKAPEAGLCWNRRSKRPRQTLHW